MQALASGRGPARARARALVLVLAATFAGGARAGDDPLDTPARPSPLAAHRLVTAIARDAGGAIHAVGARGHVLRSTDGGQTWTQAAVPLSSDLTAVQFVDARTGFAVGHDGVVLRSDDGGATWRKLIDGRDANRVVLEALQRKVDAAGAQATDADRRLLAEARRSASLGPDEPFLDLWFSDAREGFVVGAYNLVLHTADGGRTWESWADRTDNPKLLNFYAIRAIHGTVYVAGEQGLLMRLDAAAGRFRALDVACKASFFGLTATRRGVLAFGLRGNAWESDDDGRTWHAAATGLLASITAGDTAPDGRIALVDLAGGLAVSDDGGGSFRRVRVSPPAPLTAVLLDAGHAVLGGPRGLRTVDIGKDK